MLGSVKWCDEKGKKLKMNKETIGIGIVLVVIMIALTFAIIASTAVANGNLPLVTSPSANPAEITNDGTMYSQLSVNVTDADSNISNVTIDLLPIGGPSVYVLSCLYGYDDGTLLFGCDVNATCDLGVYNLTVNATNTEGNYNDSVSITLTVSEAITKVKVEPASQTVSPGQNFSVNVTVENVTNMNADGATLHFNATAMQATDIIEGEFLKTGGPTFPIEEINNTAGTATFAYSLGAGSSVNGFGVLATIEFTANASVEGMFNLNLTGVVLADGDGGGIDVELFNGTVNLIPFNINITSPENRTYASTCSRLNFTVEPEGTTLDWIGYRLDGGANVTIAGNTTVGGLGACGHNIVVYARDSNGNMAASNMVYFTLHPGDINGDGIVNVFDLQRLAWAFNSYPTHPEWNENADLNCDNKVNVFDLQLLAWNFGNDYNVIC